VKYLPFIFAIPLLAGCATYHPQPLSADKTATQLESRRLDYAGLKKFLEQNSTNDISEWPLTNWDFNSLTLAAFYFQPNLEVARQQWSVAQAGIKTAGGRPNPSVSLIPEYNTTTWVPSPWAPTISFDIPIETAGKRGKRIAEANEVAKSAQYDFITAAWKTRSDVRAAVIELKNSTRRADLLEKQLATRQQILQLLRQRFAAGEISQPELTAAQINSQQAQLDLTDAKSKKEAARVQLAQAIGVSAAALDGLQFDLDFKQPSPDVLTAADARKLALQSRADILGALADYAAAEDELRLQIAQQYPDVHLGPGYQYDQGDNKWSLGITFDLPILNQNQGPIAEAEAKRKLSAAKFVALQSQVIGEIDTAVAGWHAFKDQLATGNELFAAQTAQLKSVQAQANSGAADMLDLASAELELNLGALTVLDGDIAGLRALGALEDALQRPADTISAAIDKISKNPNGKEVRK
jgi:outer membrane protein TolC